MNKEIFRKAKKTYFGSWLEKKAETERKAYYVVKDIDSGNDNDVVMENTEHGTEMSCTCKSKTFNIDKPVFCSHMLTVILYEMGKTKVN